MDLFPQFLANGLVMGVFYALSALGLTLIFGLMRVVNFAHGEFYMLGGVSGWFVTNYLGLDFFSGLIVVAAFMAAVGWLVDRFLIERVRGQGEEPGILLTIGLSIFLVNGTLLLVGPAPMKVAGAVAEGPLFFGPIAVTKLRLLAVAVGIALIVGAHLLIRRTRLGAAMRATFQDPMAASLAGIRTGHVYAATFALGCTLAALSGMLLASIYSAQASVGGLISLKSFVVVILGGMGSFAGAIAGGLLLGVAEAMWGGYVSMGMVDVIGFVLVILILLFRPQGLFSIRTERA
ncbi:branched-chain amino acid ABC transporter permease (plasmid) [Azospirillum baldaniorum]|uniref:Branched-chain amino acid ABC transporter permease n=5 Tax=Azospirillum TaxID=191 RepID=A0A235H4L5_AZOBR|nr:MULTISPECIES: branched-chain amino acid ABC transporter permease [Azospirillum]AWJ85745.1 branched-chain amino acid ABC transporter permease [Azospirillum sp. TSH58]AWJ94679.1 branched-chain amino acid ABC transporter permease [Azospirillum baldaniorum]MBB3266730.1 branched-chain amino acid transport system permease protein [Azospirillum sp. OGB3]MBK3802941.1 branched-chain amino acid ABC transporter permease [Azospirillum argentinense]MBY3756455.1 branched-chain amino acid ABC transporter 